jgi:hypothetical protein
MIRPSLRRIAVLALCVLLAGSAVLSAKPRATVSSDSAAVSKGAPAGFLDMVWSFLLSICTKNGSSPDPFGGTKNGSASDPYGNPSSTQGSRQDGGNGSTGDPNG